jgi:hypothetical protein
VAIAEHLGRVYAPREDIFLEVVHRDSDRASGYSDADPSASAEPAPGAEPV